MTCSINFRFVIIYWYKFRISDFCKLQLVEYLSIILTGSWPSRGVFFCCLRAYRRQVLTVTNVRLVEFISNDRGDIAEKKETTGKFFLSILWNSRFEEQDFFLAIKRRRKSFRLIIVVLCLIPVVFLVLVLKVGEKKKSTFKWCNFIHWSILISVIAKWLTILKRQICLVCISLLWRNQFLEICKRRWWEFRLGMHEEIWCQKEFPLFLSFFIVCYNIF